MQADEAPSTGHDDPAKVWEHTTTAGSPGLTRPTDVPRPESVDEVSIWAGSEDLRRTVLVHAPVFWVLLPIIAIMFLLHQTITDPTGTGWNITINGEYHDSWPAWVPWLAWIGVGAWLLIAIGVLLLRLIVLRDLGAENERIFEHGVAHSIHRACVDYDDGEASWATYIALDHRLDDRRAARIHAAFEQWLRLSGAPPSASKPISSMTLFGAQAQGGYFFLHLPVSQAAGATTEHEWMLITEPEDGSDEVVVTPVPVRKRLRRIRKRLRRKAARRTSSSSRSSPVR